MLVLLALVCAAPKREIRASLGTTPLIDGILEPNEWSDAFSFRTSDPAIGTSQKGPNIWTNTFSPVLAAADSSLVGFVKYDQRSLYFGFNVTDDFLFAIDGERWCPSGNPDCTPLNQTGWPWFGDEMEILLNAAGPAGPFPRNIVGNETQWQMVTSLTKSRLGGIGVGGLLEGEPRSSDVAWNTYQSWIKSGAMRSAALPHKGGKGYVIEWAIDFALMQMAPGKPYHPSMPDTLMGINIALGDVDLQSEGDVRFGLRHENWFSGDKENRTRIADFGTLVMVQHAQYKERESAVPALVNYTATSWCGNSMRLDMLPAAMPAAAAATIAQRNAMLKKRGMAAVPDALSDVGICTPGKPADLTTPATNGNLKVHVDGSAVVFTQVDTGKVLFTARPEFAVQNDTAPPIGGCAPGSIIGHDLGPAVDITVDEAVEQCHKHDECKGFSVHSGVCFGGGVATIRFKSSVSDAARNSSDTAWHTFTNAGYPAGYLIGHAHYTLYSLCTHSVSLYTTGTSSPPSLSRLVILRSACTDWAKGIGRRKEGVLQVLSMWCRSNGTGRRSRCSSESSTVSECAEGNMLTSSRP
jgi:SSS family solute:Na+ symporter